MYTQKVCDDHYLKVNENGASRVLAVANCEMDVCDALSVVLDGL